MDQTTVSRSIRKVSTFGNKHWSNIREFEYFVSKIGKNMIFWRKIVIFHTKYPQNFRASLRSAKFFEVNQLPVRA
jgi:hypothetical protein